MHYNPERSAEVLRTALIRERAGGGNEIVVWKILGALVEIGPAAKLAVPDLTDLAQIDQSAGVSAKTATVLAVIALARIEPENPQWIDQLVESLQDSDGGVNFGAAWELGKHGEAARHAVQPLLLLAKTAQDWRTKGMAATAAWRLDSSAPNPLNSITCRMNPFY